MSTLRNILFLGLCVAVTACGSFHPNARLDAYDKTSGYRYHNLDPGPNNTDSLFVVLTFSGGGTRAAALSYGVMKTLRDTRIFWDGEEKSLLDEVDMISSVSGGSFTAAYYGIHRGDLFNGEFEDDFLNKNIERTLFYELFNPVNWFKLAGRSYGRSDLAAEYYDEHVFAKSTFQTLIDRDTRPFIMLNATDMSQGMQFPMIQDQFDLICSDLAELPVARAVASSSAFPGLLTALTYQNYAPGCGYKEPVWVKLATGDRLINAERAKRAASRRSYYDPESLGRGKRNFIHLIDGGVSDNIGLRGPTWAFNSTDPAYSLMRMLNLKQIKTLLVIVVNAGTNPDSDLDESSKVPSALATVSAAATKPMDNYSFDTVKILQGDVQNSQRAGKILNDCQAALSEQCPGAIIDTSLYGYDSHISQIAFEYIENPEERHFFQNIGTNFALPEETVDKLINIGCKILDKDRQFNDFMTQHGKTRTQCDQ